MRTYSAPLIVVGYIVLLLSWMVYSMAESGTNSIISLFEATIVVMILVFFAALPHLLIAGVQFVYPYHLVKRDETVHYRPRMKKLGQIAFVLLGVIGGISGGLNLLNFIG